MKTILQGDAQIKTPPEIAFQEHNLTHSPGVTNPLVLLQSMIDRGADPDALKKMMDLAERFDANRAAREFDEAMAQCQAEVTNIKRDARNSHTNSTYATYESLIASIRPIYTKHGFSLSFSEEDCPTQGSMRLVADVSHRGGCTRKRRIDIPLDGIGIKGQANMTATQGKMSTISYAKRGLAKMIFNIAETDEDQDGNSRFVSEAQVEEIEGLITEAAEHGFKVHREKFLAYLGVESFDKLDEKGYQKAILSLKADIARAKGKGKQ